MNHAGSILRTPMIAACLVCAISMTAAHTQGASSNEQRAIYTVKDGNKVDAQTLAGWKTWRALACERCHGAQQEGLVGPAHVSSAD